MIAPTRTEKVAIVRTNTGSIETREARVERFSQHLGTREELVSKTFYNLGKP